MNLPGEMQMEVLAHQLFSGKIPPEKPKKNLQQKKIEYNNN